LIHFGIAEYVALIAAADVSGHYGVGVLLESCLADKLAFVERTRRLIRNIIETRVAERARAWWHSLVTPPKAIHITLESAGV
jgi:ferritin-like metal-binding protein YciE